jgi:O-antigen biosynthesis protein
VISGMTDGAWRVFDRIGWSLRRRGLLGTARLAARKLLRTFGRSGPPDAALDLAARYPRWLARREPSRAEVALRRRWGGASSGPVIALVLPVGDATAGVVGRCIRSVIAQLHGGWELRVVAWSPVAPETSRVLEAWEATDGRVRVEVEARGDVADAVGRAVLATDAEWIALIEPTATLAVDALLELARALARDSRLQVVYTDEDEVDSSGRHLNPWFKPSWSPDLFLSQDYVGGLCAIRKALFARAGGLRPGFPRAEAYDLLLRVTEHASRIGHIAKVLYHRDATSPAASPECDETEHRAVEAALARRGLAARVTAIAPRRRRVRYALAGAPLVSIVVPTRDRVDLLRTCLTSIAARSTYRSFEVLVVDNGSSDPETIRYLRELPAPHRVLSHEGPFNWSAINNAAVREAKGDQILFLNNDVEVISPEWLEALLEHAQRPSVGIVGAKLLYPNDAVQHAGVIVGIGGFADHAFRRLAASEPGYRGLASVVRNVSAVTGACLMVRRAVFEELGGFDERLRVAFNDIDFCLRARERGYLVVLTPHALLYHHESATRGTLHPRFEYQYMRRRWGEVIAAGDPYYNPNLTLDREDFGLGE